MKNKIIYAAIAVLAAVLFTGAEAGSGCNTDTQCDGDLICVLEQGSPVCAQSDGSAGSSCGVDTHCADGLVCAGDGDYGLACAESNGSTRSRCSQDAHCTGKLICAYDGICASRKGDCTSEHCSETLATYVFDDDLRDIRQLGNTPPGTEFSMIFKGYYINVGKDGELEWPVVEEVNKHRKSITTIRFILLGKVPPKFTGTERFRIVYCTTVTNDCRPFGQTKINDGRHLSSSHKALTLNALNEFFLSYFRVVEGENSNSIGTDMIPPQDLLEVQLGRKKESDLKRNSKTQVHNNNYDYTASKLLEKKANAGSVSPKLLFIEILIKLLRPTNGGFSRKRVSSVVVELRKEGWGRLDEEGRPVSVEP